MHRATPAEPRIDMLTNIAVSTGLGALRRHGPEAALTAMRPWLEILQRAERKAETRRKIAEMAART